MPLAGLTSHLDYVRQKFVKCFHGFMHGSRFEVWVMSFVKVLDKLHQSFR